MFSKKEHNKDIINLDETNNDLLGTTIYANMLQELIKKCLKTPDIETIALFGEWGIGKSSIIYTVENRIQKDRKNGTKFIYYNAWKYSSDDFKKSFLINLNPKLENELYSDVTTTNYSFNSNWLDWSIIVIVIISFLLFAVYATCIQKNDDWLNILISALIFSVLESLILALFKKIIVEQNIAEKHNFSSAVFSQKFTKLVKNKKYVFVIDDIDRCSYRNTLEILECINGFMKTKNSESNYLFLIPIDKERIKHALKIERNYDNYEQNKYLDKIFDESITILNHGDINLFEMLKSKCNKKILRFRINL